MKPKLLPLLLAIFCSGIAAQTSDSGSAHQACQSNPGAAKMILTHADVPLYPRLAVEAQQQGAVNLHLTVKDGLVTKIEMKTEAGVSGLLREAAIENVRTWRFGGLPKAKINVTFVYELRGEESEVWTNPQIQMDLPTCVIITSRPQKPNIDDEILRKPK